MPHATAKRCLFWCSFAGFIGYFFTAKSAILDWPLIAVSICVMMFEAGYLIVLIDKRWRLLKPAIFGLGAGVLCIASLMVTGASTISIFLLCMTALFSVFLWLSLKKLGVTDEAK